MEYLRVLLPLACVALVVLLAVSLVKRKAPKTLYLPEFPLSTRPVGYFMSLIYMIVLIIVTLLGSIEYTLCMKIWHYG